MDEVKITVANSTFAIGGVSCSADSLKTLLLLFFLSVFLSLCHAQNSAAGGGKKVMDSLKTALQNAKHDTMRLQLYLKLGEACERKDNMLYAEPALKLADKLITQSVDESQRKKFLEQESMAFSLMTTYYSDSTSIDWDKFFEYAEKHLKYIEGKGEKRRIAETLAYMAELILFANDTSKFMEYQERSLSLFNEIKDAPNAVERYNALCNYYLDIGNYTKALESIQAAIAISKELNYKTGTARSLVQLADIYRDNGEDARALKNYQDALSILIETKDTNELYNVLAAMGGFYYTRHNFQKAIEYYDKVIALCNAKKDIEHSIASVYKWKGIVYRDHGDFTNALLNFKKSLSLFDPLKYLFQINDVLNEIGITYSRKGDFAKALEYHLRGLKTAEQAENENSVARSNYLLAQDYFGQNNYTTAKHYSDRGLAAMKKQFDIKSISDAELLASQIDSASGDGTGAYLHYKEYVLLNNKLKGEEIRKAAQKEKFQNEFDKQKAEQDKKDAIAAAELNRNKQEKYFLSAGLLMAIIFGYWDYRQKKKISQAKKSIEKEKKRSDELLLNILPSEVAEELKIKGSADAKQFDEVTVMFTDFKGFTQISEKLSPTELVAEIHSCFKAFDNIISKHNIEKIKTIGDSYMCAGGLPVANKTNATDVMKAAIEIQNFIQQHSQQRKSEGKESFEIRIGIHTGAVVAGIVGVKKFAYDIWGDTVNIASRMESSGEAGKINISGSTYELVKDKFNCEHRGKIQAKNKGEIDMYFVETVS